MVVYNTMAPELSKFSLETPTIQLHFGTSKQKPSLNKILG